MTIYVLIGASGRLGRICKNIFLGAGMSFATVDRSGDIDYKGQLVGNIFRLEFDVSNSYFIIDASIDYSSADNLNAYEEVKRAFVSKIDDENRLLGVVAFSSGAIEFSDELISDPFYQNYKNQKIKLENFLNTLGAPFLCLRIYTLIGPESYKTKDTGWVSVLEAALRFSQVTISDPLEPRSWVSECSVAEHIKKFINCPVGKNVLTPTSGIFNLTEVVVIASKIKNKNIKIHQVGKNKWLTVPYVSNNANCSSAISFSDYLRNLVNT